MSEGRRLVSNVLVSFLGHISPVVSAGLFVGCWSILIAFLMTWLTAPSATAVLWIGFILTLLPVVVQYHTWREVRVADSSFLIFWTRTTYTTTVKAQWHLLGVIPVGHERILDEEIRFQQPPAEAILPQLMGVLVECLPLLGPPARWALDRQHRKAIRG